MDIGKKLKDLRAKSGLSQEKVAERLYVSRQAISKWENNEAFPDMENLVALSKFYNVSVDYILDADEIRAEDKSTPADNKKYAGLDSSSLSPKMTAWKRWYNTARVSLAAVSIITVINYILYLCNIFNFVIPFGAGTPINILFYGMTYSGRNHAFQEMIDSTGAYYDRIPDALFYVILIFTSMMIIGYVVSAVCSNKYKSSFMAIGLILWIIDFLYGIGTNIVADVLVLIFGGTPTPRSFMFYVGWVWKVALLIILIVAISSARKIKREIRKKRAA